MMYHIVKIDNGDGEIVIHDSQDPQSKIRVINGEIQKGVNAIDNFSFIIYPNNPGYDILKDRITKIKVYASDKKDPIFTGRIYKSSGSMSSNGVISKSVTCEGRLAWLCDTLQPYREYKLVSVRNVLLGFLTEHNKKADIDKRVYLGQVTVNASNEYHYYTNWDSTYNTIADKLIDRFGGELQIRDGNDGKVYLDYLTQIGRGSDMVIKLAKNLKSISRDIDGSSVITRLYPLGAKLGDSEDRVRIGSVNGGADYIEDETLIAKYGIVEGTVIWDDVTTPNALLSKGTQWLKENNRIKKQYQIIALDLSTIGLDIDSFEVGNFYRVINPLMEIDEILRIIKITYYLDKPWNSALTLGDKFETATNMTVKKNRQLSNSIEQASFRNMSVINEKVDNATALITGAEGGHVILYPSEKPERILIMDTADVKTATSCLQFNKAGLGFWRKSDPENAGKTPLNGTYKNAWTIDGNLVAEFITALTLTGLKINNGNGTFKVDEDGKVTANSLKSNNADITGGSIHIETDNEKYDVIKLSCGDWTMELSPLQIRFSNSTIGGNVLIQAGLINCYWNDELKINISSDYGSITTYAGGHSTFFLDTNNRKISMYNSGGERTIMLDGETGDIWANAFAHNY